MSKASSSAVRRAIARALRESDEVIDGATRSGMSRAVVCHLMAWIFGRQASTLRQKATSQAERRSSAVRADDRRVS